MGWFRNIVNVVAPGVMQTYDTANAIAHGQAPLPNNLLPIPDAWVPDKVRTTWEEFRRSETDRLRGAFNDGVEILNDVFDGDFDAALKRSVYAPVGHALLDVKQKVSAAQVLIGVEKPGRHLTAEERAHLETIFGDSLDYDNIMIKEGSAGVASINGRPFTTGNTIYMKGSPESMQGANAAERWENWLDRLVHEATHVWQFEKFGASYLASALTHQCCAGKEHGHGDPAYDWTMGAFNNVPWEELNPEQQAKLIEHAARAGMFTDPNARIVMYDVDRTDYVRECMRRFREGAGSNR